MYYKGIYYEEAGKGKTVVFLHGWGGGIASFKGTFTYLSKFYRCINLEFPGFGNSGTPGVPYTVYDYAERIKDFIGFLKCGAVTLAGHSFGGRIALILAAEYPESVERIVLIDAAGLKPRRGLKYYCRRIKFGFAKLLVRLKMRRPETLSRHGSPDYRALSGVMKKTFVNVINEHLNILTHKIMCSALLVWGSKDKDTPLYMGRYFKKHIKGSRLVIYKGAGHYSYIDRFHECNLLLKDWLAEC